MPKILLRTLLLLALLFALDRLTALALSRIFPRVVSGESGGTLNFLLQRKRDANVVILGSSRAKHHLDPARLTALGNGVMYNAGVNGQGDLYHSAVVLDLAFAKGIRPDAVVLQVDAWQFLARPRAKGHGGPVDPLAKSLGSLYPYLGQSPLLDRYVLEKLDYREQALLTFHAYRYNGKVLNLLVNYFKRNRVPDGNGFEPLTGSLTASDEVAERKLAEDASLDPGVLGAFADLARLSRAHGARLVVVIPPFLGGCECGEIRARLVDTLATLGADRVLDFGPSPGPLLMDRRLWKDAGHFNAEGARLFSDRVNDSLRVP